MIPTATATRLIEVPLSPRRLEGLRADAGPGAWQRLVRAAEAAVRLLRGRRIWFVSSAAGGGGVAEMLRSLVPFALGLGLDAHWIVIAAPRSFFLITKELHNELHGHLRRPLGEDAHELYAATLAAHAGQLVSMVRPGDVAVLHDPQTGGMVAPLQTAGAIVVWRSHIGTDRCRRVVTEAWEFLLPFISTADALVFSSDRVVPPEVRGLPVYTIAPSIDPTAAKNRAMSLSSVAAILACTGLMRGEGASRRPGRVEASDATPVAIRDRAKVIRYGRGPRFSTDQLVLHLARWDKLKDPLGVMRGFTEHVLDHLDAYLLVAGPSPASIADDPEAEATLREVIAAWEALPTSKRSRVQIAVLANEDPDENAMIVNALQRASAVVVKKSLEEGFGLGATEAMWKRRPVVASRVGGLQEQIIDGYSGVLLDDATDLEAFGAAVSILLVDAQTASRLGTAARRTVRDRFLHDRHLADWLALLGRLVMEHDTRPATI